MIKDIIIGLVVLAFAVPFAYIIIADLADVYKRIANVYSAKLKPALIVVTKSFLD
jgi:hypothetical protein